MTKGKKGGRDKAHREERQGNLQGQKLRRIGQPQKEDERSVEEPVRQKEDRLNDTNKEGITHKGLSIIMDHPLICHESNPCMSE